MGLFYCLCLRGLLPCSAASRTAIAALVPGEYRKGEHAEGHAVVAACVAQQHFDALHKVENAEAAARTLTRNNTNPNGTEANAAARSVRT